MWDLSHCVNLLSTSALQFGWQPLWEELGVNIQLVVLYNLLIYIWQIWRTTNYLKSWSDQPDHHIILSQSIKKELDLTKSRGALETGAYRNQWRRPDVLAGPPPPIALQLCLPQRDKRGRSHTRVTTNAHRTQARSPCWANDLSLEEHTGLDDMPLSPERPPTPQRWWLWKPSKYTVNVVSSQSFISHFENILTHWWFSIFSALIHSQVDFYSPQYHKSQVCFVQHTTSSILRP